MNIRKEHIILVLAIAIMMTCFACQTYKLENHTLELLPYKVDDKLIFDSEGILDTIWITEILKVTGPDDPLDLIPTNFQTLFVNGQISQRTVEMDVMNRPIRRIHQPVLKIDSSTDGDNRTYFVFDNHNDVYKNPTTSMRISELINCLAEHQNECEITAKEYYNNLSHIETDLESFVWSKDLGYTKFKFRNGTICTLKEFWRNNEQLIN